MWPFTKQEKLPDAKPVEGTKRENTFSADSDNATSPNNRNAKMAAHFQHPSASGFAMDSANGLIPEFKSFRYGGVPDAQFDWYADQSFIGYQIAAIMSQHWLVDKACLMPARDAIRLGYECKIAGEVDRADDILEALKKYDKRYQINKNMKELIHMGRIYGVRVAIFRVDSTDPEYYEKKFNPDSVTQNSYRGISQVDPIWIMPELTSAGVSDPASIRFYEPEFYTINGKRYHRSHLCIYVPYPVPDTLKPQYLYAGKSLPQLIYERVYAAERTANEAPQLAMTKRLVVFKTDAGTFWSDLQKSVRKLLDWASNRDNYGVMTIDKDDEDIIQHDTSLADLDAVIMNQYQLVASIAEVPATKLLGTTPKGFNSTGDSEAEDYRIMLESIQSNDLCPLLERHHQLVWLSELRYQFGGMDVEIDVQWHPLDSPTAAEWAEINLKKAQTAKMYYDMGAINDEDVRNQVRLDKNSDFFGLEEIEFVDEEPVIGEEPEAQAPQA